MCAEEKPGLGENLLPCIMGVDALGSGKADGILHNCLGAKMPKCATELS